MYRGGHAGFNALLYAPFVPLVSDRWSLALAVWGALLAVTTANVPDVDEAIERVDHRGPTHTVWFALVTGLIAGSGTALLVGSSPAFGVGSGFGFRFGFVVGTCGIVAHLAGDVVTPMGISPFEPLSRTHVTLDWFKSKNSRINRAVLLVGAGALLASLLLTIAHLAGIAPTG
ncbi:metal-dependent hydrolase [Halosolutus halophilus]|uniref:metal-dependent hydrolase n=1 Tax=Halosolutus halophilus TaxID=1552990 RepID=UPI0022352371|nr:metal-dependent hydrolase [Halosolutus halophilus]